MDLPADWSEVRGNTNSIGRGPFTGALGPTVGISETCFVQWVAVLDSTNNEAVVNDYVRGFTIANPNQRKTTDSGGALRAALAQVELVSRSWVSSFESSEPSVRSDLVAFESSDTLYFLVLTTPTSAHPALQARFVEMLRSMTRFSSRNPEKRSPPGALTFAGSWTTQGARLNISPDGSGRSGTFERTYIVGLGAESSRGHGTWTLLDRNRVRMTTISVAGESKRECDDFSLSRDERNERDVLMICGESYSKRW